MRFWAALVAMLGATLVVGVGAASAARSGTDPDLEPGFPVKTFERGGTYHGGPAVLTLVGNIDADPTLEVLVTALAVGPLYAWNSDGSPQLGWPTPILGAAMPALGQLSASDTGFEVFSAHFGGALVAYNGAGATLPGWPREASNYIASPPSLADVDGDGLDEIFVEEEDWALHAYRANGTVLPGWPVSGDGGQERHTPAIGDLDGDDVPEIVTVSGWTSPGIYIHAYHRDGSEVAGFPVLMNGAVDTFPAIGDVDDDGSPEIVVVVSEGGPKVKVLAANGAVERTMTLVGGIAYGTAPALGDLDGDGVPEIVVQTEDALNVWRGNGTTFPGMATHVDEQLARKLGSRDRRRGRRRAPGHRDHEASCGLVGAGGSAAVQPQRCPEHTFPEAAANRVRRRARDRGYRSRRAERARRHGERLERLPGALRQAAGSTTCTGRAMAASSGASSAATRRTRTITALFLRLRHHHRQPPPPRHRLRHHHRRRRPPPPPPAPAASTSGSAASASASTTTTAATSGGASSRA